MRKPYSKPEVDFVMFTEKDLVAESECDFDCPDNCSCHGCVSVCVFDCLTDTTCGSAHACYTNCKAHN